MPGLTPPLTFPRNSPPCPGGFWRTRSGKGRKRNNECSKAPYFADHHRRAAPGYHFRPPQALFAARAGTSDNRDFGYAEGAGLNALRVFTSYEYWIENGQVFFERFEALVAAAHRHKIRVMPVLFEDCGVENTPENRHSRDPEKAVCVRSPGAEIEQNPSEWWKAEQYIREFFNRYKDDQRILAIEIMNEPHWQRGNLEFAKYIAKFAAKQKGIIPLTMGCMFIQDNLCFSEEIDIYQFHHNFPSSEEEIENLLQLVKAIQENAQKPCWLTEWQRIRRSGPGWNQAEIPEEEKTPQLHSLAAIVESSGLGNFFWCLMVKPAYLPTQRLNGTFNGLFHEDGSVYSKEDYLAIAHGANIPRENAVMPQWFLKDRSHQARSKQR